MQTNTIIVTNNNVSPTLGICVSKVDTTIEPTTNTTTPVDYDTLSAAQKLIFDDCVAMIESLNP